MNAFPKGERMDESLLQKTIIAVSSTYDDFSKKMKEYNELFFDSFLELFKDESSLFPIKYDSCREIFHMMDRDYENLMINSLKIFPEYKSLYESSSKFDCSTIKDLSLEEVIENYPLEAIIAFSKHNLNFKEEFDFQKDLEHAEQDLYAFLSDLESLYEEITDMKKRIKSSYSLGAYISLRYFDILSFLEDWQNDIDSFDGKIAGYILDYENDPFKYENHKKAYLKKWIRKRIQGFMNSK